jgi:hypothetical protein
LQFSAVPGVGSETGKVQFNIVPDDTGEGEQFGDVQFNDVPVADEEWFKGVQFNDVPVAYVGRR